MLASSLAGLTCLGNLCSFLASACIESAPARMDQIIAAGGLTVAMEAMLNHPVLKKDELSIPTMYEPDQVIRCGLTLLFRMTDEAAPGHQERRVTLRKAGVLGVLPPVVAAFTKAEMAANVHKVKLARELTKSLVGIERLEACMKGEDPLSNMLMTEDMMVLIGTEEKPGFMWKVA
jgi:hypothetical protein